MKKVLSAILVVLIFLAVFQTTTFASEIKEPVTEEQSVIIAPLWVYQIRVTRQRQFDRNATVPQTMTAYEYVGIDSATGKEVVAKGTCYLKSVAYGFPTANQKQATYEGIVTAYVNGYIINP